SNKASNIRSANRGYSTSSQVSRLKEIEVVDYELGEKILKAYNDGRPDIVNDLMSLPDSYFSESSFFYRSLAGRDNKNAREVNRIISERMREQAEDMRNRDMVSLISGFRERLKGMNIDGEDGYALAEAIA